MNHTKLPWLGLEETESMFRPEFDIRTEKQQGITSNGCSLATKEDIEFIIKACNNHYQMLGALKNALNADPGCVSWAEIENVIKQVEEE